MRERALLSVVVPVYNNEKYLSTCIETILQQKYAALEVILVDDGSTDGSGRICDAYALKDSRVRVIRKLNEGACYARRNGILAAKGEYITFVDSDDWIDVDMYEILCGILLESKADIVTSGFIRNESEESSHDLLPEGVYAGKEKEDLCEKMIFHREYNTGGIMMSVCNKIYRRTLLLPCVVDLPPHIRLWEDIVYVYPPFIMAERVVVTHKCFYHYRKNIESTSNRLDSFEYEQTVYTFDVARQVYKQYEKSIQEAFALENCMILYSYLWRRAENNSHQYGTHKEIRMMIKNISQDSHFTIPVQDIIQQIPFKQEKNFLQLLLDGKVRRAIGYCHYIIRKQAVLDWIAKTAYNLLGERRVQKIKKALHREIA